MSTTMTIQLETELEQRLARLSASMHRSETDLATDAIKSYIELNEWQCSEIRQGIKEANASDFASDREVKALLNKWGVNTD